MSQQAAAAPGPPAKRARTAPAASGPSSGSNGETAKRGLIAVNNLRYELPPDLSVVTSRTNVDHFFHSTSYTANQRMVAQLNSGSAYIDPQNTYLTFDLTVASGDTNERITFGDGSAVNLFEDLSIVSRSGDEIERSEAIWNLAPEQDRAEHGEEWFKSTGELMGYRRIPYRGQVSGRDAFVVGGTDIAADIGLSDTNIVKYGTLDVGALAARTNTGAASTRQRYCIPMGCLSQFFRSTDKLIPAALASGLRFEFTLRAGIWTPFVKIAQGASRAIDDTGANVPTWTINNPRIVCDSYQLTDSIQRAMNETIASSGIEMPFVAVHHTTYATGGQNSVQVELRKAVSRALTLTTKLHNPEQAESETWDATWTPSRVDTTVPATPVRRVGTGSGFTEFQVRVGSLYFPHQRLRAPDPSSCQRELWHHTLRGSRSAFKRPSHASASTWIDFITNHNVIWTDLERSNVQNLTGIPVNNSRVIELAATFGEQAGVITYTGAYQAVPHVDGSVVGSPASTNASLSLYLHYVRLVRVFLNNVEVEE